LKIPLMFNSWPETWKTFLPNVTVKKIGIRNCTLESQTIWSWPCKQKCSFKKFPLETTKNGRPCSTLFSKNGGTHSLIQANLYNQMWNKLGNSYGRLSLMRSLIWFNRTNMTTQSGKMNQNGLTTLVSSATCHLNTTTRVVVWCTVIPQILKKTDGACITTKKQTKCATLMNSVNLTMILFTKKFTCSQTGKKMNGLLGITLVSPTGEQTSDGADPTLM
jgi:hypothetical protein